MSTLTLMIANCPQLQQGMTRHHRFDRHGGTIGSRMADWQLLDQCQRVLPIHCEIRWEEDCFCIIDHGNRTFLNGSSKSLGESGAMRLKDGDQLCIGRYQVQVRYQEQPTAGALEAFFMAQRQQEIVAALPQAHPDERDIEGATDHAPPEICQAFQATVGYDPLVVLDTRHAVGVAKEHDLQDLIGEDRP